MYKLLLLFMGLCLTMPVLAAELQGSATVNVTSDTAANAKNMAFDEARRQIIADSLRQYVDVVALGAVLQNTKSSELMGLIETSSIDGEKLSDTTYSANITMQLDGVAVREWLVDNGVQNWLPDESKRDLFVVNVKMSDGFSNWVDLNRILRKEKIDFAVVSMTSDSAMLEIPVSGRGKFTIAVREAGWRYATRDTKLNIWK